jgi:hypothetical protein
MFVLYCECKSQFDKKPTRKTRSLQIRMTSIKLDHVLRTMQCEVKGSKEIAPTILNLPTLRRSVALIIFTKSL